MKIVHRVSLTSNIHAVQSLRNLGIEPETVLNDVISFEIDESNSAWATVGRLLHEWNALDVAATSFSPDELNGSLMLQMVPDWHYGYPQPEEDFGFLNATYDLTDYCSTCGIGRKQHAPFRMAGEPKWGKRHILQLNWVFDEYFVKPEVWKSVFEPLGVGCSDVLDQRTGRALQSVVQLNIEARVRMKDAGLPMEHCATCHRNKYLPVSRGMFPALDQVSDVAIAKTAEYFGSGTSGWNAVIVAGETFKAIDHAELKGASFKPLEC